jgi:hypothetical protein
MNPAFAASLLQRGGATDNRIVASRDVNEHARQLESDAIFQAEHSLSSNPRHHHAEAGA